MLNETQCAKTPNPVLTEKAVLILNQAVGIKQKANFVDYKLFGGDNQEVPFPKTDGVELTLDAINDILETAGNTLNRICERL